MFIPHTCSVAHSPDPHPSKEAPCTKDASTSMEPCYVSIGELLEKPIDSLSSDPMHLQSVQHIISRWIPTFSSQDGLAKIKTKSGRVRIQFYISNLLIRINVTSQFQVPVFICYSFFTLT
jgi:hypothetical protein